MREIIDIILEAAYHGSPCYWYNPLTDEIFDTNDHGAFVSTNYEKFGIEKSLKDRMDAAFYSTGRRRNSATTPTPDDLDYNDSWETLGIMQGWIRCAAQDGGVMAFINGSSAENLWRAANKMKKMNLFNPQDGLIVELTDPSQSWATSRHSGRYSSVDLYDRQLVAWLKSSPRNAGYIFKKSLSESVSPYLYFKNPKPVESAKIEYPAVYLSLERKPGMNMRVKKSDLDKTKLHADDIELPRHLDKDDDWKNYSVQQSLNIAKYCRYEGTIPRDIIQNL
jgi:hypothetical protein